jgi:threonine dehydrogenase-like Zn-dependent dehydrogenase
MGADVVVDPKEKSPYQTWAEMASETSSPAASPSFMAGLALRPGVIFECVGVPGVIEQIMMHAPRGARIVVVGVCMEQDHFEPFFGINKELNIQFVLGYTPEEFAATLRYIGEGTIPVAPLITGRVGVEGVAQAFQDLGSPEFHAKILVEPWRS